MKFVFYFFGVMVSFFSRTCRDRSGARTVTVILGNLRNLTAYGVLASATNTVLQRTWVFNRDNLT